ncbi:Vps51/Vps67-domain-containing protein, partial [Cantharellus anzutake]|uniref:Vps51/Vps67-domain-containing protein n=1 Tax=Cantharellus anzutake TaxID=1750568 RepID=UPI00190302CC
RARDLLRQHYGLSLPAPTGSPNDPLDIDSPAFDAQGYYTQLVAVSSLPTLLKRSNDLAEEIRQLETDRQALVYNHHHELVAASDTIRAMKSRAENVDLELDKLRDAFSEISRIGAKLAIEISSREKR